MEKMAIETLEDDLSRDALRDEWFGLKRVFPVASGGIYPAKVYGNQDGYGIDCIICRRLKPGKNKSLFRIVQKTTKS